MNSRNSRALRADLKFFLELAVKEPVRIHRRSGESLILINEKYLEDFQERFVSLQSRLLEAMELKSPSASTSPATQPFQ